jgi:2-polyprenyl-3-methyl-5-hydroxy-6-metoxy-1,4-benzoquinol methylase
MKPGHDSATSRYRDYGYQSPAPSHVHPIYLPHVLALCGPLSPGTRVLDLGCGNGAVAGRFLDLGCEVVGVDLSESGIEVARRTWPSGRFEVLPADEDVLERLGEQPFDLVVSTEVIEHLYAPRSFVQGAFKALRPGGRFVLTTPYHGYLKNLAIALLNRWDRHANPLWDGGTSSSGAVGRSHACWPRPALWACGFAARADVPTYGWA